MMSTRLLIPVSLIALLGISCGVDQTNTARAFLETNPARLDFELDDFGRIEKTLRLSNTGRAPMTVTRFEVLGAPDDVFRLDVAVPFDLESGEHREVEIAFVPQREGLTQGVLRIESNADNAPERDIPLSGRLGDVHQDPPDAGPDDEEEPDAGPDDEEEPDAGPDDEEEPDAGPDDEEPDAGPTDPVDPSCLRMSDVMEVGTSENGVNDLAIAVGGGKIVVGWWSNARSLQVRELDASTGQPTGVVRSVWSGTASRPTYPIEYLAGAGDQDGVVFFVTEQSNLNVQVHQIDLRGPTPDPKRISLLSTNQLPGSMAATTSRGGILALWQQKSPLSDPSTDPHSLMGLRLDGDAPFAPKELMSLQRSTESTNPNRNSDRFTAAPWGNDLVVAWDGKVGSASPIGVARLDANGDFVAGSVKQVSNSDTTTTNLHPQVVSTPSGLAVAWWQTSSSTRRAVVAELDGSLNSMGDIVLGELGPANVLGGSVAAAAKDSVVLVGWSRYTAGQYGMAKMEGLSFSGIDRSNGEVLAKIEVPRTTVSSSDRLAIAPAGDGWIAAWAESGGKIAVARITCEDDE